MNAVARDMIDCIFQLHFYALYLIAIENGESFRDWIPFKL